MKKLLQNADRLSVHRLFAVVLIVVGMYIPIPFISTGFLITGVIILYKSFRANTIEQIRKEGWTKSLKGWLFLLLFSLFVSFVGYQLF